jgi:8-amino-7-oxononanoate synthase
MTRPDLFARLAQRHAERARAGLLRRLRTVDARDGAWITVEGRRLLSFAGNDYLALAQHPAVRDALIATAAREGVGAGAAHLLGGHSREHALLEEALADWTGRERALTFSSGWLANLGVIGALCGSGDACVQDKLDHASLLDATRLAGCELKRYVHADAASAARQLDAHPEAGALVATDGVFSMDGDVAPLGELARICRERGALLHVDDAHGIGVLGPEGRGSVAEAGLSQDDVPVLMATLGKALGVAGAFVAGSAALVESLVQFARPYVYTTAPPAALAAAARAAIGVARHESWRRDRLGLLVRHFRKGAAERGIPLADSRTPIQPVLLGDSAIAVDAAQALEASGCYVPAIRPPTVPDGAARLRVSLSAAHTELQVERLLDALARAIGKARTRAERAQRPARRSAAHSRRRRDTAP